VAVIIPALDEEEAIGVVLAEIPPVDGEVIVVDNGSRDRTPERARGAGARVVSEPRRGYGQACLAGVAAAPEAEIFAFLDGDRSDDPRQLPTVLGPLLAGEADLVIGSRRLGRSAPGSHPWHAVMGTRLCVALMNRLIGTRATDLGPFRAITAPALRRLRMADRDFGWTVEMQAKAARRGLRVVEVPVDYRPRLGRSKVSGTLSGSVRAGFKIVGTILRCALERPGESEEAARARPKGPAGGGGEDAPARSRTSCFK
jgi:glycosyltransferase involved in cell wall biosynthesis